MTAILGISAFYHDSAAALVIGGEIVAAAQEERFTRKKNDHAFPNKAIEYCLREAGLRPDQLDYVAFYEKPLRKFERILETYLAFAPSGLRSFAMAIPLWLKEKLHMRKLISRGLSRPARVPLVFMDHHESHAASAFFPSPFQQAAILTLDGVGEWSTTTCGFGADNRITLTQHLQFPHSVGLLYSAFTYYCGFKVNSGEYKLMGLAPYGRPIYQDAIYRHLVDLKADGSFWLNMRYFNFCQGLTMTNRRFDALFGGAPRRADANLEQRHMDVAASIQAVIEEIISRMCCDLHRRTGLKNLVLAGGVALNCAANGRLLRECPFDEIWIQPAAGDAGGALGAALFVWYQLLANTRIPRVGDSQHGSLLGPRFSTQEVDAIPKQTGTSYQRYDDETDLVSHTAQLLAKGRIVGWFQGRMEFGPRALGARSILGDPRSPKMQSDMNMKIKFRESFRPFAPAVLQEHAHKWFEMRPGFESPYMLLIVAVTDERRLPIHSEDLNRMRNSPDLCERVNVIRSTVPAITHVDNSARVQTVDNNRNPRFYRLLKSFHELTGCPMLVNTSFNVRGEPIVCRPEEAFRCFQATGMDALVIENLVVEKNDVDDSAANRESYLAQFQLD